mmetsp:Transcript_59592/g.141794  ORF Transcript_59592/g.141794 Transcript_59592/m.141794 type:complete len:262 (-) Transcript_59592:51-836(-)
MSSTPASSSSGAGSKAISRSPPIGISRSLVLLLQRNGSSVPDVYAELLARGKELAEKRTKAIEKQVWWSDTQSKPEGSLVLIVAPRLPKRLCDGVGLFGFPMWDIVAYAFFLLHEHAVVQDKPFRVLWAMGNDHRIWPWDIAVLCKVLHPALRHNMQELHVLHPSWAVRVVRVLLWPIAEEDYWNIFQCHERVEFLDRIMDLKKLRLPKGMLEYDKFLDEMAREASEEAAKKMGMPRSEGDANNQQAAAAGAARNAQAQRR